ncbi:hypothetical protein [Gulosibacter chungangensis]|uniref:Uncharacterized protein n=1 Tax=Gulosibacter chungangensis TaxID=979746 RepID=A0A7J5BH57_9MICO|nr:hypothetical protein [Gulosibacter chungangensis]KAB1645262.1 hypothetical protein F8O05_03210 [Gulosibacter chungangensis]
MTAADQLEQAISETLQDARLGNAQRQLPKVGADALAPPPGRSFDGIRAALKAVERQSDG